MSNDRKEAVRISMIGTDDPITKFLALHAPDGRFSPSFDPNDYPENGEAIVANLLELQRLIRNAEHKNAAVPAPATFVNPARRPLST